MSSDVDLATLRRMIKVGGYLRATIGVVMLLVPRLLGPGWIGSDAKRGTVRAVIRALGIREVLLGAGAIVAANEGKQLRRWVEFAMVADGSDALSTLVAARHLPTSRAVLVFATAASSAATHGWVLSRLPEEVHTSG